MSYDLYRMYDRAKRLLYVGISGHAGTRASQHARDKVWWPQVDHITVQHLECSWEDALRAERFAIGSEKPLYNIQHNQRDQFTPRQAVVRPYQVPYQLMESDEYQAFKSAVVRFTEHLIAEYDRKTYLDDERWMVRGGATVLDLRGIDPIGLMESIARAATYAAPCEGCGERIVPDIVTYDRSTHVSAVDDRCDTGSINSCQAWGWCPTCKTTSRHYINLKDAA